MNFHVELLLKTQKASSQLRCKSVHGKGGGGQCQGKVHAFSERFLPNLNANILLKLELGTISSKLSKKERATISFADFSLNIQGET